MLPISLLKPFKRWLNSGLAVALCGLAVGSAHAASALPIAGTDIAGRWDQLWDFLIYLSIFFSILVIGAMVYFAVIYRDRPGLRTRYITGSHALEAAWIAIPTILLMVIFGWGYSIYRGMTQAPTDPYEIRVVGKQWNWSFQYPSGRATSGAVFVPVNKPVKFVMTSQDVLHGFFIPGFRIKQDVVPGMYTSLWFEAKVQGRHQVFCTEYCGTSHSGMLADLIVLNDADWAAFESGKEFDSKSIPEAGTLAATEAKTFQTGGAVKLISLAERGGHVFEQKGCVSCHAVDGSRKIGPSPRNLYGSTVELQDGTKLVADENYIRESIEKPQAKLVKGYQPVMPTFQGLIDEQEMNALMAYFRSLSDRGRVADSSMAGGRLPGGATKRAMK